jgi:hypothetical protein
LGEGKNIWRRSRLSQLKKRQILIVLSFTILISLLCSCGATKLTQTENPVTTTNITSQTKIPPISTTTSAIFPTVEKPIGLETELYKNDELGFSIEVPKGWEFSQEDIGPIKTFRWTSSKADVPHMAIMYTHYEQPRSLESFITTIQTNMYPDSYSVTKRTDISSSTVASEYTMSYEDSDGNEPNIVGDTNYFQQSNDYFIVMDAVPKEEAELTLGILRYCLSTFSTNDNLVLN